jgi:hypothetical protein
MGEEDHHPKWFTDLAEEARKAARVRVFLREREGERQTTGEAALLREIRSIVET